MLNKSSTSENPSVSGVSPGYQWDVTLPKSKGPCSRLTDLAHIPVICPCRTPPCSNNIEHVIGGLSAIGCENIFRGENAFISRGHAFSNLMTALRALEHFLSAVSVLLSLFFSYCEQRLPTLHTKISLVSRHFLSVASQNSDITAEMFFRPTVTNLPAQAPREPHKMLHLKHVHAKTLMSRSYRINKLSVKVPRHMRHAIASIYMNYMSLFYGRCNIYILYV